MDPPYLACIIFGLGGYLLGSIPFGRIIGKKFAAVDVMDVGSGNIGATNVARELGLLYGALTLALDIGKGFLPLCLFRCLFPEHDLCSAVVAVCPFLGHQYSIFLRFHGGKGVATALGVLFALAPLSACLILVLFLLVVAVTDTISLGSVISASVIPVFLILFEKPPPWCVAAFFMAFLIWFRHRDNLGRLVRGEERKWRNRNHARRSNRRPNSSSE
jgi:glycerol-3-phosphate acyltransferase PlsY